MVQSIISEAIGGFPALQVDGNLKYPSFGPAPCRGAAVVNQTPAAPSFGPAGFHPQALRAPFGLKGMLARH